MLMADLFLVWPHDLGRNIQRESSRVAPYGDTMEIRPPGFLVRGWSQELNGSIRCSGDALIAPTAAQTELNKREIVWLGRW